MSLFAFATNDPGEHDPVYLTDPAPATEQATFDRWSTG